MLFNKKGSLEISIQAIVIVVLAMTLLGLGLGFIKGMFKNITSTTEDVSEQVRQKVLDDLIQTDKKVSFPKTEIEIDKGSATVLTVGIRNRNDAVLKYKILFTAVKGPQKVNPGSPPVIVEPTPIQLSEFSDYFKYNKVAIYELASADSDVRSIRLSIPTTVTQSGSYLVRFDVIDNSDNSIYATKSFFVVVRG